MNEKQKEFLRKWLENNPMTFREDDWGDIKAVHTSDIEYLYKALKELE